LEAAQKKSILLDIITREQERGMLEFETAREKNMKV
jgi:hypothetical protein